MLQPCYIAKKHEKSTPTFQTLNSLSIESHCCDVRPVTALYASPLRVSTFAMVCHLSPLDSGRHTEHKNHSTAR
jgi:hypothetical protein